MTAKEALRRIVEAEESRRERLARAEQDAPPRVPGPGPATSVPPTRRESALSTSTTAS